MDFPASCRVPPDTHTACRLKPACPSLPTRHRSTAVWWTPYRAIRPVMNPRILQSFASSLRIVDISVNMLVNQTTTLGFSSALATASAFAQSSWGAEHHQIDLQRTAPSRRRWARCPTHRRAWRAPHKLSTGQPELLPSALGWRPAVRRSPRIGPALSTSTARAADFEAVTYRVCPGGQAYLARERGRISFVNELPTSDLQAGGSAERLPGCLRRERRAIRAQ
jgi:hypothetical protein